MRDTLWFKITLWMVTSSARLPPCIRVYHFARPRLALIERKLMKPILRRNKFVQPFVSIGYAEYDSARNILTCRNVSCTCKVSYRVAFWLYENAPRQEHDEFDVSRFEDPFNGILSYVYARKFNFFFQIRIKINK